MICWHHCRRADGRDPIVPTSLRPCHAGNIHYCSVCECALFFFCPNSRDRCRKIGGLLTEGKNQFAIKVEFSAQVVRMAGCPAVKSGGFRDLPADALAIHHTPHAGSFPAGASVSEVSDPKPCRGRNIIINVPPHERTHCTSPPSAPG